VKIYMFNTPFIMSSTSTFKDFTFPGLNENLVDSSLVLAYYQRNFIFDLVWYNADGNSSSDFMSIFNFRNQTANDYFRFQLRDLDGTSYSGSSIVVQKFKIVVAKASVIINGRKAVDYSDYKATMKYLGLEP